jgi:branched-chain amino acid transport system substrate-binding protein
MKGKKMRKRSRKQFWLVFLCLFASMLWFVGPAMAKEEIIVGAHLSLSGPAAGQGANQKWAYEQAVKDINAAGGVFVAEYGKKLPVRLIVIDDETSGPKAAAAVTQLIQQKKADFLLSGESGAVTVIAGMVTAEKYQRYYHATGVWMPDFLKHNFKWSTMYFFDIGQGATVAYEVWNSLPADQRPKKPAIFVEANTDGEQMGHGLTALAEKYGYKVALKESIVVGSKDFSLQLKHAKSQGVDAILVMGNLPEMVVLVSQMKQMNFSVKYFQGWKGTWQNEFWQILGKDAEGVLCDGFWSMDFPFAGARELGEKYYQDHQQNSVSVGMYYALCQNLWQAIEKTGTLDGAKVRQAVIDNSFDTVMGTVDYDERGVALFPLANFQWRNGRHAVVYPFDRANTTLRPMVPWDER